jgi:hypothetical protein
VERITDRQVSSYTHVDGIKTGAMASLQTSQLI